MNVYAGTSFFVTVDTLGAQTGVVPTVSLGSLPSGITSPTAFPLSVPAAGARITLVLDKWLAAGTYSIPVNATAGTVTASTTLTATVQSGTPPSFSLLDPNAYPPVLSEVAVPVGGSGRIQLKSFTNDELPANYQVQLSVSGVPAGTTATVSPQPVIPGQLITVTLSADRTAPTMSNAVITVTGTPSAPVPQASVSFLAEVTPGPGALPANRTDYISTEGSPNSAVYDPAHNLIFSSNPSWNRIDVISGVSHRIVKTIPVMAPGAVDINQDDSLVWVATASQQIYAIDTSSFAARRYALPNYSPLTGTRTNFWQGQQIFALADNSIFILARTPDGVAFALNWVPGTNTLTEIKAPVSAEWPVLWQYVMRTGDASRIYSIGWDSAGESFWYDVASKTVSPATKLGGYAFTAAVNYDGSRLAICDANGLNMYDGSFDRVGSLPGGGFWPGFGGGLLFSSDNKTLYEEAMPFLTPAIYSIDARSLQLRGIAPAMAMIPVSERMSPAFYVPVPFGVDSTGMLLCRQDWGIAFEDPSFYQNISAYQPGTPMFMQHMSPYSGPLSGGTVSSGFGNAFAIVPDVWYGATRGAATVDSAGTLTITSPPATAQAPVNLKFLWPDGTEIFDPLFFTYGAVPQYSIFSGAPPDGGVPGQIAGLGLPTDPSGGSVTVGGNSATITTQQSQRPPLTGSPFPSTFLDFTVPAGSPGWADIEVKTPAGVGVLSQALFYANSVNDYSSPDSFTAILYDAHRQQLYLSAHDHIDVFSLTTNQFLAPITPPAQGAQREFEGLALTPDGNLLLATDLPDNSVAVINPDNPASSYVIPVPVGTIGSACPIGPLYVATTANQKAFVATGSDSCGPGGLPYEIDLNAKSATLANGYCGGGNVSASHDGSTVVLGKNPVGYGGLCTYNVSQNVFNIAGDCRASTAISGDGNVISCQWMFADSSANVIGWVAQPATYYSRNGTMVSSVDNPLLEPMLNDAGSLYYVANPNWVDIVDVQHGLLRMRFSLSETISNVTSPMAIDSGGRYIYLITNKGLTIIDLGAAPLSIGHLSPAIASSGAQVTVRGSGFSSGVTAEVGGQPASVTLVDENTLIMTMPTLQSGPRDIVLKRSGGSAYTLENGVTVP